MTASNSSRLFESFVNVSHTVLGKNLKPLCLIHILWLYQLESPLVITSKRVELSDLELAVLICTSESNEEILEAIDKRGGSILKRLGKFTWRRRNQKRNLIAEVNGFLAYNDDYLSIPEFKTKEGSKMDKLPWILLHATTLIKATGWSDEYVFTMPIGKLLWLNLGLSYIETGETSVVTDAEAQAQDILASLTSMPLTSAN